LSCLDIKEPKKIISVPWFHQITPQKRGRKFKKIEIRPFLCLSTHVWGFFSWVCEWRKTLEGHYLSFLDIKEPKKIIAVPWFHQITPKKRGRKSKKIEIGPFFIFKYPCFGVFFVGVRVA